MKNFMVIVTTGWFVGITLGADQPLPWPRFRGPNGSGVAIDQVPPLRVAPETNLKWKVAVPSGLSSPIVAGDKLILTAFDNGKLYTIAYQRSDGKEAWRREAPAKQIERYLKGAGFKNVETAVVHKEQEAPYFETVLATGEK